MRRTTGSSIQDNNIQRLRPTRWPADSDSQTTDIRDGQERDDDREHTRRRTSKMTGRRCTYDHTPGVDTYHKRCKSINHSSVGAADAAGLMRLPLLRNIRKGHAESPPHAGAIRIRPPAASQARAVGTREEIGERDAGRGEGDGSAAVAAAGGRERTGCSAGGDGEKAAPA